ncbi:MAG: ATP-binding cassette domain-containing protein [Angelakisella sp.]
MLTLTAVTKRFHAGTVNETKALDNLSLTLPKGDFVTVIGSNGAGKSTLFGAVAGVFLTDSGNITLDGQRITFMPEHKRAAVIGRIFQDTTKGSAPGMTIEENLALAYLRSTGKRSLMGITAADRTLFKERLSLFGLGLEDRLTTKVGLLSGGQRQAVALLMSTLVTPKLLLLDEHTAALDPKTAKKVLELTGEIVARDNLTALMVTHNMKDAIRMGNRLIMMHEGRVIYDVRGDEKKNLTVRDLLDKFESLSGDEFANDRVLLA